MIRPVADIGGHCAVNRHGERATIIIGQAQIQDGRRVLDTLGHRTAQSEMAHTAITS